MRSLIRPGLFWVARIGLFLAVVAWIVAQSWMVQGSITGPNAVLCPSGFAITLDADSDPWIESLPTDFSHVHQLDNCFSVDPKGDYRETFQSYFPGVAYTTHLVPFGGSKILTIRHWLIVTMFALFYGVLKWVYRWKAPTNSM